MSGKKKTKVKPHERSNPKSDGKHRVKGHTRKLPVGQIGEPDFSTYKIKERREFEEKKDIPINELKDELYSDDLDEIVKIGRKSDRKHTEYNAYESLEDNIVVHYSFHKGAGDKSDNYYGQAKVYVDLGTSTKDGLPTYHWEEIVFDMRQVDEEKPEYIFDRHEKQWTSAPEDVIESIRKDNLNPEHSKEIKGDLNG